MFSALPHPRTQQEWRTVLDEVRNAYLGRQYKQCSARCLQLLQGAPDMVRQYQVTLSLIAENIRVRELCFQNCYLSKPVLNTQLLIVVVSQCPNLHNRSSRCTAFTSYSMRLCASNYWHGPCGLTVLKGSLSSTSHEFTIKGEHYMWEAESRYDVTKSELMGRTSLEMHHRFPSSSSDSSVVSRNSSVISATDSPSLYSSLSPVHSPASSVCSSFSKSEDESCDQLRSRVFQSRPEDRSSPRKGGITTAIPPVNTITSDTVSSFFLSRSITRYSIYLTTLRNRLNHHLSNITELILSVESAERHSSEINLDQSCNLSTIFGDSTPILPDIIESEQEEKAQQRRARIAQLKQRGIDWKLGRGRFDGSKYEQFVRRR